MPFQQSPFQGSANVLQMAIPLLIQKKKDEAELALKEETLKVAQEKLKVEALEKAAEIRRKADEAETKYMMDMYKTAYEKGDPAGAKQFGSELEGRGLPVVQGEASGPYMPGMAPLTNYLTAPPELTGDAANIRAITGKMPTLESLKDLKASGKTEVNVGVDVGQKSMEKLGEEMSKDLVVERKDVIGAVSSLENIKQAKGLLDSGMITGAGAEFLTNAGNFIASRLGFKAAEDPVANTQAFAATMGNQVGQIIKQFGSGTGLSDADREYAEKIAGGKITLTEQALRKLISINEKAFKNVIKNYNKKADQAMNKPGADSLPYDLRIDYKIEEDVPTKATETPTTKTDLDKKAEELIKKHGRKSKK